MKPEGSSAKGKATGRRRGKKSSSAGLNTSRGQSAEKTVSGVPFSWPDFLLIQVLSIAVSLFQPRFMDSTSSAGRAALVQDPEIQKVRVLVPCCDASSISFRTAELRLVVQFLQLCRSEDFPKRPTSLLTIKKVGARAFEMRGRARAFVQKQGGVTQVRAANNLKDGKFPAASIPESYDWTFVAAPSDGIASEVIGPGNSCAWEDGGKRCGLRFGNQDGLMKHIRADHLTPCAPVRVVRYRGELPVTVPAEARTGVLPATSWPRFVGRRSPTRRSETRTPSQIARGEWDPFK